MLLGESIISSSNKLPSLFDINEEGRPEAVGWDAGQHYFEVVIQSMVGLAVGLSRCPQIPP